MATDIKLTIGNYIFDPVPPQINLGTQLNSTESGKALGNSSTGSINGTIVNNGKAAANFKELITLKDDMESSLMGCDSCQFMCIQCGSEIVFAQFVRVTLIDFQPSSDNWVFTIPYSISFEWDAKQNNPCNPCLVSTTDSMEISPIEENSPYVVTGPSGCQDLTQWYRVTRSLSAVGKQCCQDPSGVSVSIDASGIATVTGNSGITVDGWEVARNWVLEEADCVPTIDCSGVYSAINPSGLTYYNRTRTKSYSCSAGSFSLNDSWIVADSTNPTPATEVFNVDVQSSNNECVKTYLINGTINGLETRNCDNSLLKSKFQAAKEYFDSISGSLVSRIECLATIDCPINTSPISSSISSSPGNGSINYSYSYTDRPQLLAGSLNESLSIDETIPSSIINETRILGRAQPILQFCGAVTARQKNVQFSATLPRDCGTTVACPAFLTSYENFANLDSLLCCVETQLESTYTEVYKTSDQINWDPYTCVYSRSVSWTYQDCNEVINPSGLC